ncbi:BREX-2 system phosphatase PglZ [Limnoglobus roseus]|uniref:BREX-2 system phosphatase PglZ n=1 Tax=Limnoglobus roseus TaxID=2598579 RepID=A0A5C1AG68_9BACT|nr:BREX-2 system phosphatase PglZ [Limnoglobus roseus]QEL17820.1 BREX-2 system phosphatase PglZ [Limnoglobus roseus]
MSVGTLSSQQLRSLVEDKWQRDADALAIGLHVAQPWKTPGVVDFDAWKAHVVRADTVFQVREALLDAERSKGRIILLTRLRQGDLGNDVIARLARSRLFAIDHWASLCSLFKAKELDRSVCDASLAEALLECAPADGYPPVSAGLLDAGTVWRAVCRHVFEMGEREPDLVTLLLWATNPTASARYTNVGDDLRASLRERLVTNLGEAADAILRFVDCQAGGEALALAVACQVVFGDGDEGVLDAAAARMEQYHDNRPISKHVGRALGRTANEAIADLDRSDDPRLAQQHLQRADELLRQFRCDEYAHRSRLTLLGYEQRLGRFGTQVTTALADLTPDAIRRCEQLQREIAAHRRAKIGQRTDQLSRTEMTLRLLRWLDAPGPVALSFGEMANAYRKELAFADWARESVCRGEDVPALTTAYQQLDRTVLARREAFNQSFAKSLADWTATGSTFKDVLGVEQVLAQFVAKVAEAGNRVLLVVLDGMSWPVCHELLADIRHEHWFEATLEESSALPAPVIATVPSVTTYSRTTLLSGEVTKGDSSVEKRNFEANAALKQASDKRHPPVLFHKKEVTEGARGVVGDDLSKAILSTNNRLVGVVINAIDDRLGSAQQVREQWTVNRISPLAAILKLARDSGRVVVLASDHGHVWHRPEAKLCAGDGGSRWRPHGGEALDGEIAVTGDRVREDGGSRSVIVPWTETIYYGRQQNGYHGGATPQEMVCPLVILMDRTSTYTGLFPCEYPKPDWWTAPPVASAVVAETPVTVPTPRKPVGLFDDPVEDDPNPVVAPAKNPVPPPVPPGGVWLDRLFASAGYKDQKDFVRRHAPDDDLVRRCLQALESSGGIMTPAAFAKAADIPAVRLDGLIARIQRVLNVDGYEILTFSRTENRVELNAPKLKRQFDLD